MKQITTLLCAVTILVLTACDNKETVSSTPDKVFSTQFTKIATLEVGGEAAAEISAFDPVTQRLFVVNNADVSAITVIDMANPEHPKVIHSIDISHLGGGVNSVAVHKGMLAAAVEAPVKQNKGLVAVFDTKSYNLTTKVEVGALPDMVIFSPNGQYILVANEGEPDDTYRNDPRGSVSIIEVTKQFASKTIDFSSFAAQQSELEAKGLRIFGPEADFTQDLEPEYIAVSEDSKFAWVTLQENNAIARIDLTTQAFTDIFPLGAKDYQQPENAADFSKTDGTGTLKTYPVKGMYQPGQTHQKNLKSNG